MARQSKRVKKKLATKAARRSTGGRRASFRTESLEPRIMLSATWTDADTGDEIAGPTDGDDIFVGSDGTDIVDGRAGDDVMSGGAGGDTFLFDSAADGDVKTVDGGTGNDIIDLGDKNLSDLTFSDGQITVTTDTGSFVIDHTDIETIRTADGDLSVLDGDLSEANFSGSGSWLAGDEVFSVDVAGGTADLEWDATTNSLSVTDASGDLTITHAGGDDFTIGDITYPGSSGALTVDGDVTGTIDVGDRVAGDITINGSVGAINVAWNVNSAIEVDGSVDSITVGNRLRADVVITGDLETLDVDNVIMNGVTVVIEGADGDFSAQWKASGAYSGPTSGPDAVFTDTFAEATQVTITRDGVTTEAANTDPIVATPVADQVATEDAAFSFTLPDGTFTDADGDDLTLAATLDGGGALPDWLDFDPATGVFSGTPDQDGVGSFDVAVTADDGAGGTVTETFTITVDNVNDAPVAENAVVNQTATEGVAYSYVVPADAFTDEDGDSLTLVAEQSDGSPLPDWLDFDPATRTFSGTPGEADVTTITVSIEATDPSGASVEDSFTITIGNTADAPTEISLSDTTVLETAADGETVATLSTTDSDVGDTFTYSLTAVNDYFEIDGDRLVVKAGADLGASDGTESVTIRVTDSDGLTYDETVTITVSNVNSAPTVDAGIDDQSATEDAPFSFTLEGDTFADVDGDDLTITATLADGSPLPDWLDFDADTGTFSGTPDEADAGTLSLAVTATDPDGTDVTETFDIDITRVEDAPSVDTGVPSQTVEAGTDLTLVIPADAFADDDGDVLTLSATLADGSDLPEWLTFDADTGTFSGTPGDGDTGVISLVVTADDGNGGGTASDPLVIVVTEDPVDAEPIELSGDASFDGFTGSRAFVSGDTSFTVSVTGSGSVDFEWDEASGTLTITDTDGTDATTSIDIDDLGPGDLNVAGLTLDGAIGRLEVPDGTGPITIASGGSIDSLVIDGGDGSIGQLTFDDPLTGAMSVDGQIDTLDLASIDAGGSLDVSGTTATVTIAGDLDGDLTFEGAANDITIGGALSGTLDVGAGVDALSIAGDLDGTLTVAGELDALSVSGDLAGSVGIGGDVATVTVTGSVTGTLDVDGETTDVTAGSIGADGRITLADSEALEVSVTGEVAGALVFEGDVVNVTLGSIDAGGSVSVSDDVSGTLAVAGDVDGVIAVSDSLSALTVGGDMSASMTAGGDTGTIAITGIASADIAIGGDLGLFTAGDFTGILTAGEVVGDFRIDDAATTIERTYAQDTAIEYDGSTGILTATISGSSSSETLVGTEDDEVLSGNEGNDTLNGMGGDDVLDGGGGTDTATYDQAASGVTVDLDAGTASGADSGDDTLISVENVTGSDYDDVIDGDSDANRLDGGSGDDTISAGAGDDVIIGGSGDDVIDGGDGVDQVRFDGSDGGVTVDLAAGTATGEGTDSLNDVENVVGSNYDDQITGDDGDNVLYGRDGDDVIDGAGGDDTIYGMADDDTLVGGDGTDTVVTVTSSDVTVDLEAGTSTGEGNDTLDGFENVSAGSGDDDLRGDGGDNVLSGGSGNDTLAGRGGDDTLVGGYGYDTADYSEAAGSVTVDLGAGTASGAAGNDTLSSIEYATGSDSDDTLTGSTGANRLDGGAGDDLIDGGDGDDRLIGGLGDDTIIGGSGTDTVDYSDAAGGVTVDLAAGTATGAAGEDTISGVENVDGSSGDDRITGDSGSNRIAAGAGDDIVDGGAGDDTFVAGTGSDTFIGGEGTDTLTYAAESGDVTVDLSSGTAERGGETSSVSGVENVTGGSGDDTIIGDAGDNRIDGGDGDDVLTGGGGDDVLVGGEGTDTATYSGNWAEYRVTDNGDGTYTIADTVAGRDGTDVVEDIESFQFADGTLDVEDLVNRVPSDLSMGSSSVDEGVAIGTVVGTVSVTDADVLDDHQFELVDDADGLFAIDADTGEITVTGELDHETDDYHDITVTVTDEAGETRTETIRIDVNDVNETATDLSLASNTIDSDAAGGTVVGTVQVTDVDDGDTHTMTVTTGGDRFEVVDGDLQLKAGASLDPDEGAIPVTITATDSGGATYTETLYVDVLGVNAAPIEVEAPADQVTLEDEAFSFALPAGTFTDPDGDALSLSATGAGGGALPDWMSFDPATGTFSGTPGDDDPGAYAVNVTATDPGGLSVTSSFTVTVLNVNDEPIVGIAADDLMLIEDAPFSATLGPQTFVDADGDDLAVSATLAGGDPLPDWLEFDADSWTFSGTPDNDAVGRLTITMTAEDPSGASVQESFVIEVANTNDDPIANRRIPSVTVVEDQPWSYVLPANAIIDVDAGDTLTFTATLADGSPLPDWVDFNADSLSLSGLAPIGTLKTLDIVVTGTDDSGASATRTFRVESVSAPEIDAARYSDPVAGGAEVVDSGSSDVSGIGARSAEARVEPGSSEARTASEPADEADPWADVDDELSILADDASGSGPVVLGLDGGGGDGEADRLDPSGTDGEPGGVEFDGLSGDDPVDVEFAVVEDVDFEGPEARSFSVEAAGDFEDSYSEVREEVDSMQQVVDGALIDETGDAADADAREAADAANTGSMAAIWSLARGLLGARSTETRDERGGGSGRSRR